VYGVNFNIVPWHKHLVTSTMNLNLHAMWVLAKYDMAVREDYPLLDPFRSKKSESSEAESNSRGITNTRKFYLALTTDVIKRAIERIVTAGSWDPRPKKPGRAGKSVVTNGKRGRPRIHNPTAKLHEKSQRCTVCYARVAAKNKRLPKEVRHKRKALMSGALGTVHYSDRGCVACNKTICAVCAEDYKCP